jgi:hypothetical protein
MMSDINEPSQTIGRGTLGGNPAGVVSGETFRWWKENVEKNTASIIISAHHYVLKNTTVASGEWEGMRRAANGAWQPWYHGYFPQGTPQGASFLYWVDSKPDSAAFENVLAASPGVDLARSTPTRILTTPSAENPTLSSVGARRSSMSPASRDITAIPKLCRTVCRGVGSFTFPMGATR